MFCFLPFLFLFGIQQKKHDTFENERIVEGINKEKENTKLSFGDIVLIECIYNCNIGIMDRDNKYSRVL